MDLSFKFRSPPREDYCEVQLLHQVFLWGEEHLGRGNGKDQDLELRVTLQYVRSCWEARVHGAEGAREGGV